MKTPPQNAGELFFVIILGKYTLRLYDAYEALTAVSTPFLQKILKN